MYSYRNFNFLLNSIRREWDTFQKGGNRHFLYDGNYNGPASSEGHFYMVIFSTKIEFSCTVAAMSV